MLRARRVLAKTEPGLANAFAKVSGATIFRFRHIQNCSEEDTFEEEGARSLRLASAGREPEGRVGRGHRNSTASAAVRTRVGRHSATLPGPGARRTYVYCAWSEYHMSQTVVCH